MATSAVPVEELTREELEQEVRELRELAERVEKLEQLVGTLGNTEPEEAGMADVTLAGQPIGRMFDQRSDRLEEIEERLESVENGEAAGARVAGERDNMVPAHKMFADTISEGGHSLGDLESRAARIFGEFVKRVVSDEPTHVDPSGQQYTASTAEVTEMLVAPGDDEKENLLSDVKEASQSQVVARAMREVARLSRPGGTCDCNEIDGCSHAILRFHAGRPHVLASPKPVFEAAMSDVYGDGSGDGVDGSSAR